MLVLMVLTCLPAMATKGFYAIQRPRETRRILCELVQKESRKVEGVSEKLRKEESKKAGCLPQEVGAGEPGQKQTMGTETQSSDTRAYSRAFIETGSRLRPLSEGVHGEKPTRSRPLSSNREVAGTTAQSVQRSLRASGGLPRNLFDGREVSEKVATLAVAIARAEGFFKGGSKGSRNNNPGNIRRGPDYVRFKTKQEGWKALEALLTKVADGTSRVYTVNMTLREFGTRYAQSRVWPKNVAKVLGVTPETKMWEILDTPPKVVLPSNISLKQIFKNTA